MSQIRFFSVSIENFVNIGHASLSFPESKSGANTLHLVLGFNGFGKTSLLHAMSWCLTGELATFGNDMATATTIHTANWDKARLGASIPVKVAVQLKIVENGQTHLVQVIRSRTILLSQETGVLAESADEVSVLVDNGVGGFDPHSAPLDFLAEHFPSDLKDTFVINGDAALRFIQTGGEARRGRIMGTIRALMGVKLIQDAESHVIAARSKLVTEANKNQPNAALEDLQNRVDAAELLFNSRKEELEIHLEKRKKLIELQVEAKRIWDELLGVYGEDALSIRDEHNQLTGALGGLSKSVSQTISNIRNNVNSTSALHIVAHDTLNKARLIYKELSDRGEIPNTLPSVLKTVLQTGKCVCGATVEEGTHGFQHINDELNKLGARSEIAEQLQGLSLSLEQSIRGIGDWAKETSSNQDARHEAQKVQTIARERINEIKGKVAIMPSEKIRQAQLDVDEIAKDLVSENASIYKAEQELHTAEKYFSDAVGELAKMVANDDTYKTLKRQITVAERLHSIHKEFLNLLKTDVLRAISDETNSIVTSCLGVGVDAVEGFELPLKGVEITSDYDLRALSHMEGEVIDPIKLNGATLRVLTSSLLLAMFKYSGRNMGIVLDTPVGVMDGSVKIGFLHELLKRSHQTILLVTNDEMSSAESVFKYVTSVATVEHVKIVAPEQQRFIAEATFVERDTSDVAGVMADYRARYQMYMVDPSKSTAIEIG